MHSRRPLVLVVHDDPVARVDQANSLTQAGYRCLVAGDAATALWFAMRFALDAAMVDAPDSGRLQLAAEFHSLPARPGIVLLTPVPLPVANLPSDMVCLLTPASNAALVEAVDRASNLRFARGARVVTRQHGAAPVLRHPGFLPTDSVACS